MSTYLTGSSNESHVCSYFNINLLDLVFFLSFSLPSLYMADKD